LQDSFTKSRKNRKVGKILSRIKGIIKRRDYQLYSRPYELNIVGIRSKETKANKFDDEIHVFYKTDKNRWNYHLYKATTDPGTFWLKNPAYPQGTAILKEGQYKNAYAIGRHQGKSPALVQTGKVRVMRDYDRNAILDFNNAQIEEGTGINIHLAKSSGKTKLIDKYSAGCQVFQDAESFVEFMELCREHSSLYGNSFTYTLIDFRAVRRITLKRVAVAASVVASIILGFLITEEDDENS
jgi:hypothetical protein